MTSVSTEVTANALDLQRPVQAAWQLVAEWLSPVEPGDLQLQSAPLTLLTGLGGFTDGKSHDVEVYVVITGEWVSSNESAVIEWQTTSDATGQYWTVELQNLAP